MEASVAKKRGKPSPAPYENDARRKWLLGVLRAYGTSRREFGRMVGINGATVTLFATGRRYLSDLNVYRIVRKLGVPPPSGMLPPPSLTPSPVVPSVADDIRELRRMVAELSLKLEELRGAMEKD